MVSVTRDSLRSPEEPSTVKFPNVGIVYTPEVGLGLCTREYDKSVPRKLQLVASQLAATSMSMLRLTGFQSNIERRQGFMETPAGERKGWTLEMFSGRDVNLGVYFPQLYTKGADIRAVGQRTIESIEDGYSEPIQTFIGNLSSLSGISQIVDNFALDVARLSAEQATEFADLDDIYAQPQIFEFDSLTVWRNRKVGVDEEGRSVNIEPEGLAYELMYQGSAVRQARESGQITLNDQEFPGMNLGILIQPGRGAEVMQGFYRTLINLSTPEAEYPYGSLVFSKKLGEDGPSSYFGYAGFTDGTIGMTCKFKPLSTLSEEELEAYGGIDVGVPAFNMPEVVRGMWTDFSLASSQVIEPLVQLGAYERLLQDAYNQYRAEYARFEGEQVASCNGYALDAVFADRGVDTFPEHKKYAEVANLPKMERDAFVGVMADVLGITSGMQSVSAQANTLKNQFVRDVDEVLGGYRAEGFGI